jgi:hypothetical protein
VIRRSVLVLALLCALLLAACVNRRLLYSFEQPFWSSIGGEPRLLAKLAGAAVLKGYFPRVDVIAGPAEPVAALAGRLTSGAYAAAVVGPLSSFEWVAFVPRYPATRFVLIDAPAPARDPPPNAVFLTFDRTGAFRDAGHAAGKRLRAGSGAADASTLGTRIAVLASDDSGLTEAEVDAFTRGVAETLNEGRPGRRTLPAAPDRAAIRAAVEEMRKSGVEVFLIGLGERDPLGLEALRDAGGAAIIADWRVSGAFPAQVLLSVETDVPAGIARALDALRTGVAVVQGPVRLVKGKKI